jgi:hypothetical protein
MPSTIGVVCAEGARPKMYFSYFRDLDGNKLCAYALEA